MNHNGIARQASPFFTSVIETMHPCQRSANSIRIVPVRFESNAREKGFESFYLRIEKRI
ncbi:hypothetical protein HALO153_320314 [Vreelandella titanicae]|nr:hypothetical protein HALO153_320314 [Halomonas titanicae]